MDEMQTSRVARMIGQAILNEGYTLTVSQPAIDQFALERTGHDNACKGLRGRTSFRDRNVLVGELPPWDLCQVLAHELAHMLLHDPLERPEAVYQPEWQHELEAESVARHVLEAFGVEDDEWSARYIGQYLQELPPWQWDRAVRASRETILEGTSRAVHRVAACEQRRAA